MRIVLLTQYYPPETGAPQNRLSDLARRFARLGHQVCVLTAKPNYPNGVVHKEFHGGLWKERHDDGVRIVHCALYASNSKKAIRRLLSYFSFVISSAVVGALRIGRADFVIVESPPLFLGMTAWFLSKLKSAAMVFNVSDLYPETAVALGYVRPGFLLSILSRLERFCYRSSVLITTQTEGIAESIRKRFPDRDVLLMTNGVDPADFPARATGVATVQPFTIGYAGIIGLAQGLGIVIDAAERLQRIGAAAVFMLYGDGPLRNELQSAVRERGLNNVVFGGHRTRADILNVMRSWGAGLVPLMNSPLMAGALPSKMFEIMATGIPVILSAPEGEASRLIQAADAGICLPAGDPNSLAEAVDRLSREPERAARMGENGRVHVIQFFDREAIAARLVDRLDSLRQPNGTPPMREQETQ